MYYRDKEDDNTPGSVLVDVWREEPGVIVLDPDALDAPEGIPIRWHCSACDLHGEFVVVPPPLPGRLYESGGFFLTSSERVYEDALDIHDMTDVIGSADCPGAEIDIVSTDEDEARLRTPGEINILAKLQ